MKILLIKPRWFYDGDGYKFKDFNRVAPLNLGIIAALSDGHEVKIIDEDMENIEYSPGWDLVGITAATFTSKQAYDISENFRKLKVKTVLGGVHPSFMPEEALKYCDSVVIGEAEAVWQELLKDAEKKDLQRVYNGNYTENLDGVPFPRRDLFSRKYFTAPLQITRGCTKILFRCATEPTVISSSGRTTNPSRTNGVKTTGYLWARPWASVPHICFRRVCILSAIAYAAF